MKVLILTASVGEGHNAAARAVTEEIKDLDPDAEVQVVNGLKRVGSFWEKFVVDGYKIQLDKAQWSYSWLYWSIVKSKKVTYFYKGLCSVIGCRKIKSLIEESEPDIVLSTYPLTSAMLASLKRRGKVKLPCANLVTDFAPHPMWMYPDLDDNYVMHIATIEMVATMMEPSPTTVVAPLVARRFLGPSRRAEARATLGVPDDAFVAMVVGGGWGVGNIERSARAVATVDGVWTLVICGRNEELRKKLSADAPPRSIIMGFVDNMPDLIDASDLAVQNAGGLTSLEALRRGCPLLITDAIPGHGVANGELMDLVGVARYVRDPHDLPAAVAACRDDPDLRVRAERLAEGFATLPSAGSSLVGLYKGSRSRAADGLPDSLARDSAGGAGAGDARAGSAKARRSRRLSVTAALVAIVACFLVVTSGTSVSFASSHLGLHGVVTDGTAGRPAVVLCIRAPDAASLAQVPGLLKAHKASASFFLPSGVVEGDPALVASLTPVGDIQNGGTARAVSRLANPLTVRRWVEQGSEGVAGATGKPPLYYLPVQGSLNPMAYLAATQEHLQGVVGAAWVRDGRGARRHIRAGDVVVVDLRRLPASQAAAVVSAFLDRAQSQGLAVVGFTAATAGPAAPAPTS